MTNQTKGDTATSRRGFLRRAVLAGVGVTAVAAAAAGKSAEQSQSSAPVPAEAPDHGYRLTPHIRAYYRTAGL